MMYSCMKTPSLLVLVAIAAARSFATEDDTNKEEAGERRLLLTFGDAGGKAANRFGSRQRPQYQASNYGYGGYDYGGPDSYNGGDYYGDYGQDYPLDDYNYYDMEDPNSNFSDYGGDYYYYDDDYPQGDYDYYDDGNYDNEDYPGNYEDFGRNPAQPTDNFGGRGRPGRPGGRSPGRGGGVFRGVRDTGYADEEDYDSYDYYDDSGDYDDFSAYVPSAVDAQVSECLKNMPNGSVVDVVVDMSPQSIKTIPTEFMDMLGGDPTHPKRMPAVLAKDVAEIIDSFSHDMNLEKVQVIIRNGSTRYYVASPKNNGTSESTTTTTTHEPHFFEEEEEHNHNHDINLLGHKVKNVLMKYLHGHVPKMVTKNPSSRKTVFTVVMTDGFDKSLAADLPDKSIVFDVSGKFASSNKGYAKHNVIIVHPPEIIFLLMSTARYMVCQELGGIN